MAENHDAPGENERYLTTLEVARLLRVTPETVRRLGRSGRLRGFILSDKSGWRFRQADVDTFIQSVSGRGA
jgi:excisionase family DNA binding protein